MEETRVNLSAPWTTLYREMREMFGADPDIIVRFEEEESTISLYVKNAEKASALSSILPSKRIFGNVGINISVVSLDDNEPLVSPKNAWESAFRGNPVFSFIREVEWAFSSIVVYVVFKNTVVQFFNDNLGDLNGLKSTLYEDIARDIFTGTAGVSFCTELDNMNSTVGEWL